MKWLFLALALAAASADDPTPSEMDTFFELANDWLDAMSDAGTDLTAAETAVLDGITNMSARIVATEQLIVAEGENIGEMSDRIEATADLLGNLTTQCAPFCNGSSTTSAAAIQAEPRAPIGVRERGAVAAVRADIVAPTLSSCGPLSEFNDLLNASLVSFETLEGNMSSLVLDMVADVGTMGDRIVATELLIMNFSSQILTMSDRIVATEYLVGNLTADCCQAFGSAGAGAGPGVARAAALAPLRTDWVPRAASLRPAAAQRSAAAIPSLSACKPWKPWCCAMDAMESMMEAMIDAMTSTGVDVANLMAQGLSEMNVLADDIVTMEKSIADMGEQIGVMADSIVDTEELMQQFAESEFCSGSAVVVSPRSSRSVAAVVVSPRSAPASAPRTPPVRRPESNPFGDFAEMVKLMTKMASTMADLMNGQLAEMGDVSDVITTLADEINETAGYINDFATQVNDMGDRIVAVETAMSGLMEECSD